VSSRIRRAIETMKKHGHKVVLVGEVKGSNIEVSPQGLAAATSLKRRRPRASVAFVALNAPFRTKASAALG
jgi:hypothetical protein